MLDAGYRQVGRDFPVFLHPETREEYALARTERKTGPGYRGFELSYSPDVTLEDDLSAATDGHAMARERRRRLFDPLRRARRSRGPRRSATCRRPSAKTRCGSCAWPASSRATSRWVFPSRRRPSRACARSSPPARPTLWCRSACWQETAKALAEPAPAAWLRALRECGALARISRTRCALWRAATREMAPRDRHRSAHGTRACRRRRR